MPSFWRMRVANRRQKAQAFQNNRAQCKRGGCATKKKLPSGADGVVFHVAQILKNIRLRFQRNFR